MSSYEAVPPFRGGRLASGSSFREFTFDLIIILRRYHMMRFDHCGRSRTYVKINLLRYTTIRAINILPDVTTALYGARPMAANLPAMLRSMLKARQTASLSETSLLREAVRSLPPESANGRKSLKDGAPAKAQRRTLKCPRINRHRGRSSPPQRWGVHETGSTPLGGLERCASRPFALVAQVEHLSIQKRRFERHASYPA